MKKIALLFAVAAATYTTASAQVHFAPEVGVSFNKMTIDPSPTGTSMTVGGRIGGVADIKLSDNIYLQPGIAFAMKGGKADFLGIEATTTLNYLEIPINVMYKFGNEGSGRFFAGLGPNLAYAVSGKTKVKGSAFGFTIDDEEDATFGSDSTDIKAFDFGGNVFVGYELPMGLYARAYYQMGFANLANDGSTTKNMGFGLSVGYMFGTKAKKTATSGQ